MQGIRNHISFYPFLKCSCQHGSSLITFGMVIAFKVIIKKKKNDAKVITLYIVSPVDVWWEFFSFFTWSYILIVFIASFSTISFHLKLAFYFKLFYADKVFFIVECKKISKIWLITPYLFNCLYYLGIICIYNRYVVLFLWPYLYLAKINDIVTYKIMIHFIN